MRHSGLNTTFLGLIISNYGRKGDANFSKIIQSIRKQTRKQANTSNKPQERESGSVLIVVMFSKMSNLQQRNTRHAEEEESIIHILGEKAGNRNCL